MITQISVPHPFDPGYNQEHIEGDDLEELLTYCLAKVRTQSKAYYEHELRVDLMANGLSLIDRHAGMGYKYSIQLKTT